MTNYDSFYGRVFAATAAATDAYTESLVAMPVPLQASGKNYWVPVVKQVDFEVAASSTLTGLSADAALRGFLVVGDTSQWAAVPTYGNADPNTIAGFSLVNALTTSGEVIFDAMVTRVIPGDGLIIIEPYCTLIAHNLTTGLSLWLQARIWYEYTLMDEMTYMRAIHGMNF